MNNVTREIGSLVIAVILVAVPALTSCAFLRDWPGFVKLVFLVASVLEAAFFHEVLSDSSE